VIPRSSLGARANRAANGRLNQMAFRESRLTPQTLDAPPGQVPMPPQARELRNPSGSTHCPPPGVSSARRYTALGLTLRRVARRERDLVDVSKPTAAGSHRFGSAHGEGHTNDLS